MHNFNLGLMIVLIGSQTQRLILLTVQTFANSKMLTSTGKVSSSIGMRFIIIFQVRYSGFVEMLKLYVEIKCQLDETEVFIADLIACSTCFGHHCAHHQELKSIIQWLLRVVFFAVVFQVAGLVWS